MGDPCSAGPCVNGDCFPDGYGGFECSCDTGYSGTFCDVFDDPCSAAPCENSGTCSSTPGGAFSCTCGQQYTGPYCETVYVIASNDTTTVYDGTVSGDPALVNIIIISASVSFVIIVPILIFMMLVCRERQRLKKEFLTATEPDEGGKETYSWHNAGMRVIHDGVTWCQKCAKGPEPREREELFRYLVTDPQVLPDPWTKIIAWDSLMELKHEQDAHAHIKCDRDIQVEMPTRDVQCQTERIDIKPLGPLKVIEISTQTSDTHLPVHYIPVQRGVDLTWHPDEKQIAEETIKDQNLIGTAQDHYGIVDSDHADFHVVDSKIDDELDEAPSLSFQELFHLNQSKTRRRSTLYVDSDEDEDEDDFGDGRGLHPHHLQALQELRRRYSGQEDEDAASEASDTLDDASDYEDEELQKSEDFIHPVQEDDAKKPSERSDPCDVEEPREKEPVYYDVEVRNDHVYRSGRKLLKMRKMSVVSEQSEPSEESLYYDSESDEDEDDESIESLEEMLQETASAITTRHVEDEPVAGTSDTGSRSQALPASSSRTVPALGSHARPENMASNSAPSQSIPSTSKQAASQSKASSSKSVPSQITATSASKPAPSQKKPSGSKSTQKRTSVSGKTPPSDSRKAPSKTGNKQPSSGPRKKTKGASSSFFSCCFGNDIDIK